MIDDPAAPSARQATAELYAALSRAQGAVEAAEKSSKNTFHGYSYASAEEILAVGRRALSAQGLALLLVDSSVVRAEGQSWYLDTSYMLVHSGGQCVPVHTELEIIPDKGRPVDKATLAARTESLGYVLRDLLLIPRVAEGSSRPLDVTGREDAPERRGPRPVADRRAELEARIDAIGDLRQERSALATIGSSGLPADVIGDLRARLTQRLASLSPPAAPATAATATPAAPAPSGSPPEEVGPAARPAAAEGSAAAAGAQEAAPARRRRAAPTPAAPPPATPGHVAELPGTTAPPPVPAAAEAPEPGGGARETAPQPPFTSQADAELAIRAVTCRAELSALGRDLQPWPALRPIFQRRWAELPR